MIRFLSPKHRPPAGRWFAVVLAVVALVTAGCTAVPGDDRGALRVQACAASTSLIPAVAVNDECAQQVLDSVTARLTTVAADGEFEMDLAESITSTDGQSWTVELADRRFSDGTPVLAHNFVDAWNWSASCAQSYPGAGWFRDIAGYAELQPSGPCPFHTKPVTDPDSGDDEDRLPSDASSADPEASTSASPSQPGTPSTQPSGSPSPSASASGGNSLDARPDHPELSGLEMTGERSFTIELNRPIWDFDERLAELPFAPLPDSFWVDPGHYGETPVGAGPHRLIENNPRRYVVQQWDGYTGPSLPAERTIIHQIWQDQSLAYAAVRDGELDVTDEVPVESLAHSTWRKEFGPRATTGDQSADLAQLAIAAGDSDLADVRRREALSMAIDREFITERILGGTRTPAAGWVPEQFSGSASVCGAACRYDAEEAKELWAAADEAGGEFSGPIHVTYSAAGGQSQWVDELCSTWKWVLDVECERHEVAAGQTPSQVSRGVLLVDREANRRSAADFLTDFNSDSPRNAGGYRSDDYDQIMREADASRDPGSQWRMAQNQLSDDLPSLPLWWAKPTIVWSESVTIPAPPATLGGRVNLAGAVRE